MSIRPRRSVLYMPGSNARAIEKARTLAADAVILDLEDSVAPDAKDAARRQVTDAVSAGGFGAREVIVRINGLDTQWWLDDVNAVGKAKPDAVLVPKVSSPSHPEDVAHAKKIIAAFELPENRDKGVVQLDGRMIERLHADMARRTVAIAQAIEARRHESERV